MRKLISKMKKILVIGGAGYIGSVVVKRLCDQDYNVTVFDNLSTGRINLVDKRAKFHKLDVINLEQLRKYFKRFGQFDAVIHFAAAKDAGESMVSPTPYTLNIVGISNVLICMDENNCKKIVFSSSAAVYGTPKKKIIDEKSETNPINYYGFSKLEGERIIDWYRKIKRFSAICFRYFNVAGDELGYTEKKANNLFPAIKEVLEGRRKELQIYGNAYKTKDGTCIRDYIHVSDLADAHVLALDSNYNGIINLGTGRGYTVLEVLSMFEKISGKNIAKKIVPRREGDPVALICSNALAKKILGWKPKHDLKKMVEDTIKVTK